MTAVSAVDTFGNKRAAPRRDNEKGGINLVFQSTGSSFVSNSRHALAIRYEVQAKKFSYRVETEKGSKHRSAMDAVCKSIRKIRVLFDNVGPSIEKEILM